MEIRNAMDEICKKPQARDYLLLLIDMAVVIIWNS
jgi:hypothetical protein